MGLTMGCARCHSHKFDPISHKEFYQFFAFFNNVPERGLDGQRGNALPTLLLTTPAQQKLLDELDAAIAERKAALEEEKVAPAAARMGAGRSQNVRRTRRGRRSSSRPDGVLRARRQFLGYLRPLSARAHDRRRSDVRRRADRPGGDVRWRYRGQLRQRRPLRACRAVRPRGVAEAARESADGGLPEAGRPDASSRVRVAARRPRALRHSEMGGAAHDHPRLRCARQRSSRCGLASGSSSASGRTS